MSPLAVITGFYWGKEGKSVARGGCEGYKEIKCKN